MKRLLLILILTLSFQTFAKADDIKDFQIEGISIGDSLLDHFSEKKIQKSLISDYPNSDKYKRVQILNHKSFKTYDAMHLLFLKNDKKKIIHSLNGMKNYVNKTNACLEKKNIILKEISKLFQNVEIGDSIKTKHNSDKSGKSYTYDVKIKLLNGDRVYISCYDWSSKMKFRDHLRIGIHNKKFVNWLDNDAYK